jgi:hypothetical protein
LWIIEDSFSEFLKAEGSFSVNAYLVDKLNKEEDNNC